MHHTTVAWARLGAIFTVALLIEPSSTAQTPAKVNITWDKVVRVSKATTTLQVVVNPPLRRGSSIHDQVFQALRDLGCDYGRYVPWLPYPKLAVAELEPPTADKTSWDFSLIDPMTIDFLEATKGHSVILNFSTIPQWMFKTEKPVTYPADPNQPVWDYTQGTGFRDSSLKEVGDYYGRLFSWYTHGGFTDELGRQHESGTTRNAGSARQHLRSLARHSCRVVDRSGPESGPCTTDRFASSDALRVAELHSRRTGDNLPTTQIYLGLHVGEVFYGNIGSDERLDFTVVGPAVNEVARIAAMCRSVERDVLVSQDFADGMARLERGRLVSVGRYALRGVERPQELFTIDPLAIG